MSTFSRGATGRHETVVVIATKRPVVFLYHSRQNSHVSTHSAEPRLVDLSIIRVTQRAELWKDEPFRTIVCVAGSGSFPGRCHQRGAFAWPFFIRSRQSCPPVKRRIRVQWKFNVNGRDFPSVHSRSPAKYLVFSKGNDPRLIFVAFKHVLHTGGRS